MRDDGGTAFPNPKIWDGEKREYVDYILSEGMSLRDWFAGNADVSKVEFVNAAELAAFLGEEWDDLSADVTDLLDLGFRGMARVRYMMADAMLKERER